MDRLAGWIDRVAREPTAFPAVVVLPDGRRSSVMITDVSNEGCQVAGDETLPIGKIVRIELAGGIIADASVRWQLQGRAGLQFTSPLDG